MCSRGVCGRGGGACMAGGVRGDLWGPLSLCFFVDNPRIYRNASGPALLNVKFE